MLSLEQARAVEPTYHARESVRNRLDQTTLIAVVGGIAVGKNFLMQASDLPITGTETTRDPRPDDDKSLYTYSSQQEMLAAIESKELIQFGIAPNDDIYGSRLRDYTLDGPNTSDIWASYVRTLSSKGFERVGSISVFSPREQWMSQLALRSDTMSVGQIDSRLDEARFSIKWSLAKHLTRAADHLIIINGSHNVDENVERISEFAHGKEVEPLADDQIFEAAHAMNKVIDTMYTRLKA